VLVKLLHYESLQSSLNIVNVVLEKSSNLITVLKSGQEPWPEIRDISTGNNEAVVCSK